MKKNRLISLLVALLMLCTCACAFAEEEVFVKVGDQAVLLSEAQTLYDELLATYQDYYLQYNIEFTQADAESLRDYLLESLAQEIVLEAKAEEFGLTEITDEEKEDARLQAEEEYKLLEEDCIAYYVSMYQEYYEMDEEAATEAAKTETEKYLQENGITVDYLYEEILKIIPTERLYNHIVGGCEVTDAEIEAEYQLWVEEDQQTYADVFTYELSTSYYGYLSAYRPEGYRSIKYIMLKAPEEISTAMSDYEIDMTAAADTITALSEELEAAKNPAEGEEYRSVDEIQEELNTWQAQYDLMQKEYDEMRASIMPALQSTVDEINGRIAAGEDFTALMDEYGQDEFMKLEPDRTEGSAIHAESIIWDAELKEVAMALENIGDISEASLVGSNVYIVLYYADLPGGALPMDDVTREQVSSTLLLTKQESLYTETVQGWVNEMMTESHPELLVLPEFETDEEAVG